MPIVLLRLSKESKQVFDCGAVAGNAGNQLTPVLLETAWMIASFLYIMFMSCKTLRSIGVCTDTTSLCFQFILSSFCCLIC